MTGSRSGASGTIVLSSTDKAKDKDKGEDPNKVTLSEEDIKDLKIMFATFKYDIDLIIEEKVGEILRDSNKSRLYVERGYR